MTNQCTSHLNFPPQFRPLIPILPLPKPFYHVVKWRIFFTSVAQPCSINDVHSDSNPKGCLLLLPLTRRSRNHSLTLVCPKGVTLQSTQVYLTPGLLHFGEFCLLHSWSIHQSQCVHSKANQKCLQRYVFRDMHCPQDARFQTAILNYPMHAHCHRSIIFLAHFPRVHTHMLGPLHVFHRCGVILSGRSQVFSKVQIHYIVISYSSFGS